MAKENLNQQEAESTVFENLGLDPADLGAGELNDTEGQEGQDTEQEQQPQDQQRGPQELDDFSPDESRVTHTERQPQRDQQQQRQPRPLPQNAPVKADQRGNLVNAQGVIVAKAGKEARLYTDAHKARQALAQTREDFQQVNTNLDKAIEIGQKLHEELEKYKERDTQMQQIGLQPQEMLEGAQLYAEAKKDPLAVLKKLLTRAAAAGIDLTPLGMQKGAFDPAALMEMFKTELANQTKPLRDASERQTREQRETEERNRELGEARRDTEKYFKQNPDMVPYIRAFQEVLKQPQFAHMSLGEVGMRIKYNLLMRERQSTNRQQPSLPNSRGGMRGANGSDMATPDTSYDAIVRSVLDRAGIR